MLVYEGNFCSALSHKLGLLWRCCLYNETDRTLHRLTVNKSIRRPIIFNTDINSNNLNTNTPSLCDRRNQHNKLCLAKRNFCESTLKSEQGAAGLVRRARQINRPSPCAIILVSNNEEFRFIRTITYNMKWKGSAHEAFESVKI